MGSTSLSTDSDIVALGEACERLGTVQGRHRSTLQPPREESKEAEKARTKLIRPEAGGEAPGPYSRRSWRPLDYPDAVYCYPT